MTPAASFLTSPALQSLFGAYSFSTNVPAEGFMARMANPAQGFDPIRTPAGTEILFLSNPAQLPHSLSLHATPQWRNGLGLVVFRNEEVNAAGAIFIHGAMKTPWSAIRPDAWQALGGIMAFSGGVSFDDAIEMVLGKGYAMTPKWRFIDHSLKAVGHPTPTDLGGAKAILLHGPSVEEKRRAIATAAEVSRLIGIYVSGTDQNTGFDPVTEINWSDEFARRAPHNFMGSHEACKGYEGMRNPSPFTARGVFNGLKVVRQELTGRDSPVFFQGYGGVGKVMVAKAIEEEVPISGLSDAEVDKLVGARRNGVQAPLFLDLSGTVTQLGAERATAEEDRARQEGITVVPNLVEALRKAPGTVILSPNAGPHPITLEVAEYLVQAGIRAVVGGANNTLGLVDGSPETVAWILQEGGVFVPNDSRINRMGAMSVTVRKIGLDPVGLGRQEHQVGEDVREEIQAYRRDIPPQFYSDEVAARDWNQALKEGRAVGGYFEIRRIVAPPKKRRLQ